MAADLTPDEIRIGDRARTDLGDLTELIASIKEVGLLQPIVITADRELVAGGRRLAACRQIGMERVPVRIAENITDAVSLLVAERDENTCRKAMTPSELVVIGMALEALKKPEAEARKREGRMRGAAVTKGKAAGLGVPENPKPSVSPDLAAEIEAGRTDVLVSKALGVGKSSYYRAKMLVQAAEAGDERAAEAVAEMDRTGKVAPVYNAYRGIPGAPSGPSKPAAKQTATKQVAPPLTDARGRRIPQRSTHDSLTKGIRTLSGLCAGLAYATELPDAVTAEEATQWTRDLSEAMRVLRNLKNLIKERTSDIHD